MRTPNSQTMRISTSEIANQNFSIKRRLEGPSPSPNKRAAVVGSDVAICGSRQLEEIADLVGVGAKCRRPDQLQLAWAAEIDSDGVTYRPGPPGHDDDPIREEDRF